MNYSGDEVELDSMCPQDPVRVHNILLNISIFHFSSKLAKTLLQNVHGQFP